jgi:glycosyltransferase involved in cell wall biosynthesis
VLPKRLIFHVPTFAGGGAERVFVLMANALAARGHHVTLFTWNAQGPNAALRSDAVHLVDLGIPLTGDGFGKPRTLVGLWRSAQFYRRQRPDAVFSGPEFANLVTTLALKLGLSSAKFFPSFHAAASIPSTDFGSKVAARLAALVAARATSLIAVSAGIGRDLAARGVPERKIAVIHNPLPPGIHDAPVRTYPWQAELAALGQGPVIVTAGRLTPVKDQRTLLAAFAQLRATRPARLVVFGDGPLRSELEAEAARLGIAGSTLFPGYVNEPAACYAVADLFALSSVSEGFGNVLIEAMAAGVPVVSTDAPHGPREILQGAALGPLVPVGDAAALAAAMSQTLDAPIAPHVLKARAAEFKTDVIADRYEALLKS